MSNRLFITPEMSKAEKMLGKTGLTYEQFKEAGQFLTQKEQGMNLLHAMQKDNPEEVTKKLKNSKARLFFMLTGFFTELMAQNIGRVLVETRDSVGMPGNDLDLAEIDEVYATPTLNDCNWMICLQTKILKLLLVAENEEAKQCMEHFYSVFYRKEYNSLRRFKSLSADDLVAISEIHKSAIESENVHPVASNLARVTTMGLLMGCEFTPDATVADYIMSTAHNLYKNIKLKRPHWKSIPEGSLIKDVLEKNEVLGLGLDIFNNFDEATINTEDDYERCRKILESVLDVVTNEYRNLYIVLNQVLESPAPTSEIPEKKEVKKEVTYKVRKKSEVEKENEELKKKMHKLQQDYNYIGDLYEAEKEYSKRLETKLEEQKSDKNELIKLREEVYRMTEDDIPFDHSVTIKEKEAFIKEKKIVIIGGSDNWTKKLKDKYDNWRFISADTSPMNNRNPLLSSDYVYFFTDVLSHSIYYKHMKYIRDYHLEFGYLHSTNIEATINQIYEDLQ